MSECVNDLTAEYFSFDTMYVPVFYTNFANLQHLLGVQKFN
jgi:hypothetical protein